SIDRTSRSPLFPYTTLFRSARAVAITGGGDGDERDLVAVTAQHQGRELGLRQREPRTARPDANEHSPTSSPPFRADSARDGSARSEEHTSELQSRSDLVCRL